MAYYWGIEGQYIRYLGRRKAGTGSVRIVVLKRSDSGWRLSHRGIDLPKRFEGDFTESLAEAKDYVTTRIDEWERAYESLLAGYRTKLEDFEKVLESNAEKRKAMIEAIRKAGLDDPGLDSLADTTLAVLAKSADYVDYADMVKAEQRHSFVLTLETPSDVTATQVEAAIQAVGIGVALKTALNSDVNIRVCGTEATE